MKTLRNFSRSLSSNKSTNKDMRYKIEQQYKMSDHENLIFSLYSLEHTFNSLCQKDKMDKNKIQNLIIELDAITMTLSRFQDCGKEIDMLYEDMHEMLAKSTTKIQ